MRRTGHRGHGFAGDDRGQILILTGVLLVLGFVVIGSTVVQIQTLEESTTRQQRDSLLDGFSDMVKKFNQTIQDGAILGETSRPDFVQFSGEAEKNLIDQAARRGIYLSVELKADPSTTSFWRADRCAAWMSEQGGVIFSFDESTQSETIVGAVYEIYATDGRQSIRTDYYVKIEDCVQDNMLTYLEGAETVTGTVAKVAWAQDPADGNKTMYINETLEDINNGFVVSDPTYDSSNGWGGQADIEESDNVYATQNRPANNNLKFHYSLPGVPDGAILTEVTFGVEAYKDPLVVDDILRMRGETTGNVSDWETIPVTLVEAIHELSFPNPDGGNWTKSTFENTTWELQGSTVLAGDADKFYVDHVNVNVSFSYSAYDLNATIFFDAIPQFFTSHYVNVTYTIERGTVGETFDVQVWQEDTRAWVSRATLDASYPTWGGFNVLLAEEDFPNNARPRFRVVDSDGLDMDTTGSADLDVIRFDHFRIRSIWDPPT